MRMIYILGRTWIKNYYKDEQNPDNYIKTKTKFSFLCNASVQTITLTKEQKKSLVTLDVILELAVMIPFSIGFGYLYFTTKPLALKDFFFGIACVAVMMLFLLIFSKMRYNKAHAYLLDLSERFLAADEHTTFPLLSWSQFLELEPLITEKLSYAMMCFIVAEQENNLMAMKEIVRNIDEINYQTLPPFLKFRMDAIYLMFYSYREIDPEKATKHYTRSKDSFDKDPDSNGRRRMAYYAYYILHDEVAAAKYVEQGIKGLEKHDPLRSRYENELERKMLFYLKSQLEGENAPSGNTVTEG